MGLINTLNLKKLWDHISKGIKNPKLLKTSEYWSELFKRALRVEEFRILLGRLMEKLKGYKTYLVAIAVGAVTVLHTLGYIDDETFKTLLGILNGLGLATISAKMNRVDQKIDDK